LEPASRVDERRFQIDPLAIQPADLIQSIGQPQVKLPPAPAAVHVNLPALDSHFQHRLAATTVYIQIFETNILRLLEEHDMTKQELADKADISISFLSDLTHGKANPSLKIMESIANAFEVPLPYLLESTELSFEQLAELRQDSPAALKPTVPSGYERVSAILPEFQAFQVKQWAEAARKRLRR
jgi:transcriptional regulator with XRE-family HTH domain